MAKHVKNIIIGFGKAGKTLAGYLGSKGESVILVEESKLMYGGTCINVGCIPSKALATSAERRAYSNMDKEEYYKEAVKKKKALIAALNKANYDKADAVEAVEVVDGKARFLDEHTVAVDTSEGTLEYVGERIFINTGARPFVPPIKGLEIGGPIYTSEEIMNLETLPEKLLIIGSGYIGLEFASIYRQFGSEVTVIDLATDFLPREDTDIAQAVKVALENMGVTFELGVSIVSVETDGKSASVTYSVDGLEKTVQVDGVLVATGRRANVEGLDLDKAGVELTPRGTIAVNEYLQTNKDNIFALGDVNGGPQFTYVSLDDFRVVKSFLFEDGIYSTKKRGLIPNSVFIHPTLSNVGLSEKAAQEAGYKIKVATLPVTAIPKAKILGNQVGLYKAVVDAETSLILGATLFAEESHEVINTISTAMSAGLPYTSLRDQIYTHPTMSEALNDLFALI
ncbi:FAD-dependent oxidoreductase [Granulicatella seriolae]|uniref:FAD-dependent oxidoreductase n=1 Tax=Granulicatella seriolae TaxID=2967226 RepID=A0ABT1WQ58_9LACT|nr:FAD-dependent oxidoreductase [Granulicatella seriolae]